MTLPCAHTFEAAALETAVSMRKAAGQKAVCPLCAAELPGDAPEWSGPTLKAQVNHALLAVIKELRGGSLK